MKHAFLYLFSLPFIFSSNNLYAKEVVEIELPNLDQISKVELIIVPTDLRTRAPLSEKNLPIYGCTFSTTSEKQYSALLSILSKKIKTAEKSDSFALRNAVYLHLKNSEVVKLLLNDPVVKNGDGEGKLEKSSSGSESIKFNQGMLKKLRIWAKDIPARKNFSEPCLQ